MRRSGPVRGPPPLRKKYHKAALIRADGGVSALCFKRPRAIDLRRALWTLRDEAVTCPKCLKVLQDQTGVRA